MIQVNGDTGADLDDRLRRAEADLAELQVAYEARGRHMAEASQRLVAELEEEHLLRAGFREAIGHAQQQAANAEAAAEELRHTVRNRDEQIAALEAHVAMLDAQLAERDAHLADIEANRAEVQRSLDAVMHSKTMRVVRPVRAAFGWLRDRARS